MGRVIFIIVSHQVYLLKIFVRFCGAIFLKTYPPNAMTDQRFFDIPKVVRWSLKQKAIY